MNRIVQVLGTGYFAVMLTGCMDLDGERFKNRVNEATAEQVAKRYGAPHKSEKREGGATDWTYFERGSGTAGYSGISRSGSCRAYVLTFDQQEILRDWKQTDCRN